MIGIYFIKNILTNQYYIGQSSNLQKRLRDHRNNLVNNKHHNKHLQSSWNKYGEKNFIFKIIEECDIDNLNDLEVFYIKKFDSFHNGFNKTAGGDFIPQEFFDNSGKNNSFYGRKHTKESKQKMREAKIGKKLSQEHKNKISKKLKGRRHSLDRIVNETAPQNTTGYFRVSTSKAPSTKQGFTYNYSYTDNRGKRHYLHSVDIKKLEKKVKLKKLPWFKLEDYKK